MEFRIGCGYPACGAQLASPGKAHHQAGHNRGHNVLNIHLKRELRIRQRALHRYALNRC
jgi:hypothetical protein